MRKGLIILLICCCGLFATVSAQSAQELPYHPNSYHLLLPEGWLKPKLIRAITDILPQTLEQLKDKDFCTSCKADYTVMLIMDSITIGNGQQLTTLIQPIIDSFPDIAYGIVSFYAALRLFDSNGRAVVDLQLINTDENLNESIPYALQMQQLPPSAPYDIELLRTSRGAITYLRNTSLYNNLPSTPVYRRPLYSNSISFMGICERRIYQIKRLLRRLQADPA